MSDSKDVIINLSCCRYKIVYRAARKVGWTITKKDNEEDNTWTVFWMDKSSASTRIMKLRDYQMINHFPVMDSIARKHKLSRNMRKMARKYPKEYNFYPLSFELPLDRKSFFQYVEDHPHPEELTYIIKPNAESCGRGIVLSKNAEEVYAHSKSIVQLYVDHPLTIEKKKFDLRIYLFITSLQPLTMYMFQKGIVRICTEDYESPTKSNVSNGFMHFTNYTLNKKNKTNFVDCAKVDGSYCQGNKRDFTFFRKWLKEVEGVEESFIFEKIEDVLCKTVLSSHPFMLKRYLDCMTGEKKGGSYTCFEILGFDIMFDKDYNPWLLEVNHSPSYNLGTKYDEELKLELISEAFLLLGIDPSRRKKTLRRETLLSHKRLGKEVNEEELEMVAPCSREEEKNRKEEAEKTHLQTFKRIYPTERTVNKYGHLLEQDVFSNVVFKEH